MLLPVLLWYAVRDLRWGVAFGVLGTYYLSLLSFPISGILFTDAIVLASLWIAQDKRLGRHGLVVLLCYLLWLGYLAARAGSPEGWDKWQKIAGRGVVPLAGVLALRGTGRIDRLLSPLLILSGAMTLYLAARWVVGASASPDRLQLVRLGPIHVGRAAGLALLLLVWKGGDLLRSRGLVALAAAIAGLVLLLSGSRGPLLGLVVCLPFLVPWRRLRRGHVWSALAVVAAGFVIWQFVLGAQTRARLTITPDALLSSQVRIILWQDALEVWRSARVWGQGLGSFASRYSWAGLNIYPHSLVFEVLSELGIVGAGLLLAYFVATLVPRFRGGSLSIPFLALVVFFVLQALVSGDLTANIELFVLAPLLVVDAPTLEPGKHATQP